MVKDSELNGFLVRLAKTLGRSPTPPSVPGSIFVRQESDMSYRLWERETEGVLTALSPKLTKQGVFVFLQGALEGTELLEREHLRLRRKNPARKPRKGSTAREYIGRPSQATKRKPTKRLRKRRTVNVKRGKTGAFPNPRITGRRIKLF